MPRRPAPAELVPYDRDRHSAFVMSSWVAGAERPRQVLRDLLRRPETRVVVAEFRGSPDDLLGWAAARGPSVVWAYSVDSDVVRRRGLMISMLLALGVDVSRPTPCLFWSRAAAEIASSGAYRIYYDPWAWTLRPGGPLDRQREERTAPP